LNNGQPDPRAGWAFSHGLDPSGKLLIASGRLEKKGPFGDDGLQTSNRAELRAIIAVLRFRYWPGEGATRLVIATDSEYAVEGSTKWAKKWVKDGWKKSIYGAGDRGGRRWEDVKNRDLWEALLGEIERYKEHGMVVQFWRIPRDWNHLVDAAAKEAAQAEDAPSKWTEVLGINL
jgi:ribonuclease HI